MFKFYNKNMKKILIACCLLVMAYYPEAQSKKPKQPSLSELQKQLDNLSPEQKAMMKNMGLDNVDAKVTKAKSTNPNEKNPEADSWEKAEQERISSIGTVTTKTIGAAGGVIKSANGKVTLNIPGGALTNDTEIGIEEAANTAPLACGNSFKLTPDGQTFSKPVLLTLKYSDYDIDGTVPEALTITTESNGVWMTNTKTEVDAVAKTITLPISHFSVWGSAAFLKILMLPEGDRKLGRGQTINFRITTYKEVADKKAKWEEDFLKKLDELVDEMDKDEAARKRDEELTKQEWNEYVNKVSGDDPDLVPLVKESPKTIQRHIDEIGEQKVIELLKKAREIKNQDDDLVPLVIPTVEKVTEERLGELLKQLNKFKGFRLTAWRLNGSTAPISNNFGKLNIPDYGAANYTAPLVVPLNEIRVVGISCEFINLVSKAKFIFVTHVTLTNNGWFSATIDGNPWSAHQLLDQQPATQGITKLMGNKPVTQLTQAQEKAVGEFKSADANYIPEGEGKGLWLTLTNGYPKTLILQITTPHLGANTVDCTVPGVTIFTPEWGAGLTFVTRTPNGSSCDDKEFCKSFTINLTALNLKTGGLVSGNFSGHLYGPVTKACVSDHQYNVSGKFSLSVISVPNFNNITTPQKTKNE